MRSTDRIILPFDSDFKSITKRIKSDLENQANKIEGSFASDNVQAVAKEIAMYYDSLEHFQSMHYVMYAEGRYLDHKALEVGISRKEATKARGLVTFKGRDDTFIPKGFIVRSDSFEFETLEAGTIVDGQALIEVESRKAGSLYNIPEGAIYDFESLAGLEEVFSEPIEGGTDREGDDNLRDRTLLRMRYPGTSGNQYHYMHWAMEVEGVGRVKVFPLWQGNGTVKVSVLNSNQMKADDNLINKVKLHIDGTYPEEPGGDEGRALAPIGATLTVSTAEEVPFNIDAEIIPRDDNPVDLEGITEIYKENLQEYFNEIAYTDQFIITRSKLIDILLDIDGVSNVKRSKMNDNLDYLELGEEQIASVGTINLSEVV